MQDRRYVISKVPFIVPTLVNCSVHKVGPPNTEYKTDIKFDALHVQSSVKLGGNKGA